MRISRDMRIAGYPVFEIRKLMRKARERSIRAAFAEEVLGISAEDAETMMNDLAVLGYLRPDGSSDERYWEVTIRGAALALAKAGAPIRRKTANRIVADFLQCVEQVNASEGYAYCVIRVICASRISSGCSPRLLAITHSASSSSDTNKIILSISTQARRRAISAGGAGGRRVTRNPTVRSAFAYRYCCS